MFRFIDQAFYKHNHIRYLLLYINRLVATNVTVMAIQDAYWLPFTLFRWVLAQVKYCFSEMKALC